MLANILPFMQTAVYFLYTNGQEGLDNPMNQDNELDDLNRPSVDFLILADRAEVLNGKLYMMGGGWDRLNVGDFGKQQTIGIAVGLQIPWHATNQQHQLNVRIESIDNIELFTAQLGFTPGRPPVLRAAEAQRVIFAFAAALTLPGPGTFTVKAIVNDVPDRRGETFFNVALAPGSARVA
jgi:Family of unknown function (DUF6941)